MSRLVGVLAPSVACCAAVRACGVVALFVQRLDRRVRPNQVKDLIADREHDDVRRALGRAPRDFTEYVQRTAASGV